MCCTITYHHIKYCGKLSEQWHKYWKLRREEGENVEKNFLHLSLVIIEHNINIMTSLTSKWKLRDCIGQSKNWGTSLMSLKISWWTKISILLKKKGESQHIVFVLLVLSNRHTNMGSRNSIYYFPRVHIVCRRYCCLLAHQARGYYSHIRKRSLEGRDKAGGRAARYIWDSCSCTAAAKSPPARRRPTASCVRTTS